MSEQGRRRRQEGGRPHKVTVRLSEEERLLVEARARKLGVSVPRLLAEAALARRTRTATERRGLVAEFLGARRLVAGIGNNVNQLARVANATGEVPAELLVVVAAAKRMIARLDEAAAELRSS